MSAERWNLWCSHDKVRDGVWSVLLFDLSQALAVDELIVRRDRVRRGKQPCRFKMLPVGESPPS